MDTTTAPRMRASDAERERVANAVQDAAAEGRLTMPEAEERLSAVYSATWLDELAEFTADLPERNAESTRGSRKGIGEIHPALRVHVAIVIALSVLLIGRWIALGSPFFWPIAPTFWLVASVAVHAAIRRRRTLSG